MLRGMSGHPSINEIRSEEEGRGLARVIDNLLSAQEELNKETSIYLIVLVCIGLFALWKVFVVTEETSRACYLIVVAVSLLSVVIRGLIFTASQHIRRDIYVQMLQRAEFKYGKRLVD